MRDLGGMGWGGRVVVGRGVAGTARAAVQVKHITITMGVEFRFQGPEPKNMHKMEKQTRKNVTSWGLGTGALGSSKPCVLFWSTDIIDGEGKKQQATPTRLHSKFLEVAPKP